METIFSLYHTSLNKLPASLMVLAVFDCY